MIQEANLVPFHVSPPKGDKALILAPHPDDETLGCGGTIRLLLLRKTPVKVIFLTSGEKAEPSQKLSKTALDKNSPTPALEKGDAGRLHNSPPDRNHITHYALLREKEAVKALRVLGVSDYEFFRFPDRELDVYYKDALERLLKAVETYMPDTIYSPSVIELNPDHRATAALSLEIQRIAIKTDAPHPLSPPEEGKTRDEVMPIRLVFYEITTPLRPNMLIDITTTYNKKKKAIKKYTSQLKLTDYLKHITSLNTFRSLTIKGSRYVEAFWCTERPLSEEDIAKWLSYQQKISERS
jgi:LmbE family N-acetylglucosaminyl deacetylase